MNFRSRLYRTYFDVSSLLAVCFFVFDQDKHGYFETPELKLLMNILHKVPDGETVKVSNADVVKCSSIYNQFLISDSNLNVLYNISYQSNISHTHIRETLRSRGKTCPSLMMNALTGTNLSVSNKIFLC